MPIIGTIASSTRQGLATGNYESIATATFGTSGVNSVTFSAIPNTYKHLEIRAAIVSTVEMAGGYTIYQFNNDSGTNYTDVLLSTNGSTMEAPTQVITADALNFSQRQNNCFTNSPTVIVHRILNYTATDRYKNGLGLYAAQRDGVGEITHRSGQWKNTAAISSIKIFFPTGSINFGTASYIGLYGIKD